MSIFFAAASPEHQKREKNKAKELRQSQWWKNQLGRGVCYHCEQRFPPAELTMDHVLPIARGGKSDRKNCVPSCKACNTKKGHKLSVELVMDEMTGENLVQTSEQGLAEDSKSPPKKTNSEK